jgi:hypothetical protein
MQDVRQVVLARAEPYQIGFSSIGGNLDMPALKPGSGIGIEVGPGPLQVLSPIAPGTFEWIPVHRLTMMEAGEAVKVALTPSVIALDGEREIVTTEDQAWSIRLSCNGPHVVDSRRTLQLASERGFFVRCSEEGLPAAWTQAVGK